MLRIVIKKIRNYKDNKWGDNRMAGGGGGGEINGMEVGREKEGLSHTAI